MRATTAMVRDIAPLVKDLWPEHTVSDLERILAKYIADKESAIFTQYADKGCVGVALCCLRHDYVEGCETSPVGYLEGIYVDAAHRKQGIARALTGECEAWARNLGCAEFASDCELTNAASLAFHLASGFAEENRIICFKKTL